MRSHTWVALILAGCIAAWTTSVAAGGIKALSEKAGVELGQPLQFYGQLDGIAPDAVKGYRWDFGDGGTSSEQNPKYTFKDEGTYNVSVTVTLKDGKKFSDQITVQAQKECQC